MRVVLFGAGASYGSGPVSGGPTPLGNQLFDELRVGYPTGWGVIADPLKAKYYESFESGMGALLTSGSHAVPVLMQQMATYFSRFRPGAGNLYVQFAEKLGAAGKLHDVAFASLNYECVLDLALCTNGHAINYFEPPSPQANVATLLKLHGSCNFLPGPGITATRAVSYGSAITFNMSVQAVDPSLVEAYCGSDTALYPAMAHYAPGKAVQIAQVVIQEIQAQYAKAVSQAAVVAVIGIRPNVDDHHVWNPLAGAPGRLLTVGDPASIEAWRSNNRHGKTQHLGDHFDSVLDTLVAQL